MAVGAGKIEKGKRIPLDVKAGDRILFGKYTGNDIKIDDQEYLILREEEILGEAQRDRESGIWQEVAPRVQRLEAQQGSHSPRRVKSNGKANCNG